ncbi:MAG TPA: GntR family transcriptional regulator [Spirochaetales bacterium]|nr:GntR family transcriptional regulator [Spirochaetales bacterium]HRY54654.1 GntR family transcriptional regulator [Spirochaetia bacterium]
MLDILEAEGEGAARTISDRLYLRLRRSILLLELAPGQELVIKALAEELGVSRSPLRDALLRLAKESLVDILPQQGTRVSRIDLERVDEERFLRASLEEKALGLFVASFRSEASLRRLGGILDAQGASMGKGDYRAFLDGDDEFHGVFFEAAGKSLCWDLVQGMSGHYRRVRLLNLRGPETAEAIHREHGELLGLVRSGDEEGSLRAIRAHLSKILVEEERLRGEYPEYFVARRRLAREA